MVTDALSDGAPGGDSSCLLIPEVTDALPIGAPAVDGSRPTDAPWAIVGVPPKGDCGGEAGTGTSEHAAAVLLSVPASRHVHGCTLEPRDGLRRSPMRRRRTTNAAAATTMAAAPSREHTTAAATAPELSLSEEPPARLAAGGAAGLGEKGTLLLVVGVLDGDTERDRVGEGTTRPEGKQNCSPGALDPGAGTVCCKT